MLANRATRTAGKASGLQLARKRLAEADPRVKLAAARVLAHGGERAAAARDKVENAMVAVSLAEGGDFDAAQDVLNEKDLLAEHKL